MSHLTHPPDDIEPLEETSTLEDFLDEEAVDVEGAPVGIFACYWEQKADNPLLLGVNIAGPSGRTHLVPARGVRFSERQANVQVRFTREKILQAPSLEHGSELDPALEESVWLYYSLPSPRSKTAAEKSEALEWRRISRRDASGAASEPA